MLIVGGEDIDDEDDRLDGDIDGEDDDATPFTTVAVVVLFTTDDDDAGVDFVIVIVRGGDDDCNIKFLLFDELFINNSFMRLNNGTVLIDIVIFKNNKIIKIVFFFLFILSLTVFGYY